jgi:3-(3-hydroxy-phenyl)propionate hydroxylase
MDDFRHGRVLFVGDAAHQFSPFGGGRGGNSGVQDADNLAWKLAAVVQGLANERLLDSYDAERRPIAVQNLADSSKSTEFITPKSAHSLALHDAVLGLAKVAPFAQRYVNTGRFAVWPVLETSPLSIGDRDAFEPTGRPGTPVLDCVLERANGDRTWLTEQVGDAFVLVVYGAEPAPTDLAAGLSAIFPTRCVEIAARATTPRDVGLRDVEGDYARIYDAAPGTVYLFRPDQHVLARWRRFDAGAIETAIRAVLGS